MRARDLARLVRARTALTVPGEVPAGAAGRPVDRRAWCPVASSVCRCWTGRALNDYADRHVDAAERPERPVAGGEPQRVPPAVIAGARRGGALPAVGHSLACAPAQPAAARDRSGPAVRAAAAAGVRGLVPLRAAPLGGSRPRLALAVAALHPPARVPGRGVSPT